MKKRILPEVGLESFFLDSGAHSLHAKHIRPNKNKPWEERHAYFHTEEFTQYLKKYSRFVARYEHAVDYYVNVDVIFNPELSWEILKRLEGMGMQPVPVIHYGTPTKWIEKHLEEGYTFLGIGGLGQEVTKSKYYQWADRVFDIICSSADRRPLARTHGFAMTSFDLLSRYPWWSVDSASWLKSAAYGGIYVPPYRKGKYMFNQKPLQASVSTRSSSASKDNLNGFAFGKGSTKKAGNHYSKWSPQEKRAVEEWAEYTGLPMGSEEADGTVIEKGLLTDFNLRAHANLIYFDEFAKSLRSWNRPFTPAKTKNIFSSLSIETFDTEPLASKKDKDTVRIYFSGVSSTKVNPEVMIPDRSPSVMLSYYDFHKRNGTARNRFRAYLKYLRKNGKSK